MNSQTGNAERPPRFHPQAKICGLTDPEQAARCAELGADAIGFVFFPKSPRHLDDERAWEVRQALPEGIAVVGVFVDEGFDEILRKVERCGLTAVQLHGAEPPDLVERLRVQGLVVIKALFGSREPSFAAAPKYGRVSAFIAEYGAGPLPGGNAERWDYRAVAGMTGGRPLVVAGGLTPETVGEALEAVRPEVVDVSSGVEESPGIKDMEKVRRFLEAVRGTSYPQEVRRVFP